MTGFYRIETLTVNGLRRLCYSSGILNFGMYFVSSCYLSLLVTAKKVSQAQQPLKEYICYTRELWHEIYSNKTDKLLIHNQNEAFLKTFIWGKRSQHFYKVSIALIKYKFSGILGHYLKKDKKSSNLQILQFLVLECHNVITHQ